MVVAETTRAWCRWALLIALAVPAHQYLHKLRDMALNGTLNTALTAELKDRCEGASVEVDKTQFATMFEDSILRLNKLTPHQAEQLERVSVEGRRRVRVFDCPIIVRRDRLSAPTVPARSTATRTCTSRHRRARERRFWGCICC